jgi:subtilase family serine protease
MARDLFSRFLSIALLLSGTVNIFAFQVAHNVPAIIQQASDQGPANPNEQIRITIYLKMSDRAAFDAEVQQRYNPASPKYHNWMTSAELATFAPTQVQVATVRSELEKHGLLFVSRDPLGFSMRFRGSIADVQNTFETQIHQYVMNGRTFRAHTQDAQLTGNAGQLLESVSGLDSAQAHPMLKRAIDPRTGQAIPAIPFSQVNASGGFGLHYYR